MKSDFVDELNDSFTKRVFQWSVKRMYKLHSPGHAHFIMSEAAGKAACGYNSKHLYSVVVSVWLRGETQMLNVTNSGGRSKEESKLCIKLLKGGIKNLEGTAPYIRNVL